LGGFALIAWPAEYGNSGVMTFLVNHAGTVYQKDLGSGPRASHRAPLCSIRTRSGRKWMSRNTEKGRVCCGHFSVAWRRSLKRELTEALNATHAETVFR